VISGVFSGLDCITATARMLYILYKTLMIETFGERMAYSDIVDVVLWDCGSQLIKELDLKKEQKESIIRVRNVLSK
jgi:hypothetical protein